VVQNNFMKNPSREQPQLLVRPPRLATLSEISASNTDRKLELKYGEDVDRMCGDHEVLIKTILEEEDDLIATHRD
jgi:hypothetical protein